VQSSSHALQVLLHFGKGNALVPLALALDHGGGFRMQCKGSAGLSAFKPAGGATTMGVQRALQSAVSVAKRLASGGRHQTQQQADMTHRGVM
jgi:hypothetical protein